MLLAYLGLAACLLFSSKLREYGPLIWTLSSGIIFTTLGCEWLYAIHEEYGYLDWEGIIILVFYGIELNKKFYKSVYESQTEVDVVGEISSHIAVLLKQIIEEEGADFDQQAKDFVETFCLGLTYTMIDNLFRPHPLEYDVIASKVDDALHFTLNLLNL
ncbi:TetR family transcriptional regulator C-terminal domain-containing protein [Lactobacillus delbrueckii subsp. bulgaricus]|nr:TetR family transcriptional regulator C-terminal domain-containing protein [Lactobacillus delbrueckii subsp. bulgaricus]MCD5479989.1 TetR family transcriptional regulator C-terminal domain-containing protein [Lactobacillus delbrueckii subsp. bulgaricus]